MILWNKTNIVLMHNLNSQLLTTALNWYLLCFRENKIGKIVNERGRKMFGSVIIIEFQFHNFSYKDKIGFRFHHITQSQVGFEPFED